MRPKPVKTYQTSICVNCLEPIYYGHPKTYDGAPLPSYIPKDCDYISPVGWYHEGTDIGACAMTWAKPIS